ncbi:DUF4153 domain-containing protein [Clostridium tunisiense]|uniref:DUF4153 domain-containing protein n=1 Tax=Clostridium tunisiense TaxID=219748 RepID=UPI0002F23DF7|nr:DUF4153 domain-containing protein [Clostridium tunisiense]
MKIKETFFGIFRGLKDSLKRFPLTIGLSTICVILMIYYTEVGLKSSENFRETLSRVIMIYTLGIPLSLSIKVFFERKESYKKSLLYTAFVVGGIILALYYYIFLPDLHMVSITRYIGINLILYLTFIFIPYLSNNDSFELYVIRILTRFFTTVVYSMVLFLGLVAILFTIDELLGVNVRGEIYIYFWFTVVGVFAPSFFLAGVPVKNEKLELEHYPKLFRVLILYIVMPLISVYTIILYIYFGKIIITTQWPQGLVSHLVLWYSVISVSVLFLITTLLAKNNWAKRFMKVFPKVIIPLIVMMFISMGIRINAYGVTENRYYVVVLGIWVFLVMIYFSFAKNFRNIILPISLTIIAFISIMGPISSYSISKYSQNKRFEEILIRNNMLKENQLITSSSKISQEDKKQLSSILRYFNLNHSLKDIKHLPDKFRLNNVEEVFGFKLSEEYDHYNDEYFNFNTWGSGEPLDIKGYDYLFDTRNVKVNNSKQGPLAIQYDYETGMVKIFMEGKEVYSKDLTDYVNVLLEKYGTKQRERGLSVEEMSFTDENSRLKVKIQFYNVSGRIDNFSGKADSKGLEYNILIKIK